MKNPLNKRMFRDLKEHKGRYLAISIMLIITTSVLSGFLSNMESIKNGIKYNKINCRVEDGLLESYYIIPDDVLDKVKNLNVEIEENFYKDEDVLENSKLRIYKNRNNINIPNVTEGRMAEGYNEITIDRLFSKQNNLKIGSEIKVSGKEYKITGTLALPDYTSLFEKNSNIMMDSIHFGVAIVGDGVLESQLDSSIKYNYSYYFKDRNLSKKEKMDLSKEIEKILVEGNVGVNDFCTQENNQSITFIEDDMGSDEPMMKMFCYILVLIMAFVFTVTIISSIEEDAPIIGTLLANGYKKKEILIYYLKTSMFVTLISAVIGNIAGYTFMPYVFKSMYYTSYSLPDFKVKINSDAMITTTIIPISIMFLVNVLFITRKLSLSPLKFIRKDLKKKSNGRAIKLPDISFLKRFRIRVILQSKSSFLILFIGILFGSLILIFGMVMRPMVDKYIYDIKKSSIADYQYVLKKPYKINSEKAEEFTMSNFEIYFDKIDKDLGVTFYGIDEKSNYIDSLNLDNTCDEVFLSDGLMKKLKVKEGDFLTFKNSYTDDEYKLKVLGSYDYSAGLAAFMSRKSLNKLLGYNEEYFNGYFSNDELNIDDNYLASVIIPDDMVKLGEQITSAFGKMAVICVISAVIIYVALMYVLTKVIIEKNSLYISYMKVFGYNNNEINDLYLKAATVFVIFSLIIEIPIETYLLKVIFETAMAKVSGYIEVFIPWYIFLVVIVIGVISYLIVNHIHMKDIYKVKMSDALKCRE